MLLMLPRNAIPPNRAWKPYPGPLLDSLGHGQVFDFVPAKGIKFQKREIPKLFIGARGLIIDTAAGRIATMQWPDCVAVIRDQHDRSILARDGTSIGISPEDWKSGYNAIALVDRYTPAEIVVR
jgi:hypothetical protein